MRIELFRRLVFTDFLNSSFVSKNKGIHVTVAPYDFELRE